MLFTFQLMKHRPTAFKNFVNYDLLKEFMQLNKDEEMKRKYSETFNVSYIGEIGERWHEREGLIKDAKDLLALTVALGSNPADVLYTQRELFGVQAIRYLLDVEYDFVTAATVLSYTVQPHLSTENSELAVMELFEKVLNDTESIERLSTPQFAFVLYNLMQGLSDLHGGRRYVQDDIEYPTVLENMKQLSFTLVDQLIAQGIKLEQFATPFDDVPILEMLAKVYSVLDKPKAKDFKTKGVVRYLQCFEGLMFKEVDLLKAIGYVDLLKVELRSVFIYNYELAILSGGAVGNDSTVTGPGCNRIKQNFVDYGFLAKIELEAEYKDRLDTFRQVDEYLGDLFQKAKHFKNPSNLAFLIQDLGSEKVVHTISKAHMDLLETGLLTDLQKYIICKSLLEGSGSYFLRNVDLNEREFKYLFEKIKTLQQENAEAYPYPSSTKTFIINCLKFEVFTPSDIETIEEHKAESVVASYLFELEDIQGLLVFVDRIDVKHHQILLQYFEAIQEILITKEYSKEMIQRFYDRYLNVLFELRPEKYATTVYEMQKDDELFKSTFELSVTELEVVEKKIFETNFLKEKEQAYLYKKYTSPEIVEAKKIEKLKETIKTCSSYYRLEDFYEDHYLSLVKNEELSRDYTNQFIQSFKSEVGKEDSYDAGQFLTLYYRLKATAVLTVEDLELIETMLMARYSKFENKVIEHVTEVNKTEITQ